MNKEKLEKVYLELIKTVIYEYELYKTDNQMKEISVVYSSGCIDSTKRLLTIVAYNDSRIERVRELTYKLYYGSEEEEEKALNELKSASNKVVS